MLDQQLSQQMSSKGIGVADMMLKQLMRNAGGSRRGGRRGAARRREQALGGMSGGGGDSGANAGNIAAMNAMAKAYANAAAERRVAAVGQGLHGEQRARSRRRAATAPTR